MVDTVVEGDFRLPDEKTATPEPVQQPRVLTTVDVRPGGTFMPVGGAPAAPTAPTAPAVVPPQAMDTLPPEARALLDTIAGTESPGYDVVYGGSKFGSFADHPRRAIPITSGPNVGRTSTAAGRYQFLSTTWDEQKERLGLTDFSPANQDKAAWNLAQEQYKAKTGRNLLADLKSGNTSKVGAALAGTWTSLPGGIEQGTSANSFNARYGAALSNPSQTPGPQLFKNNDLYPEYGNGAEARTKTYTFMDAAAEAARHETATGILIERLAAPSFKPQEDFKWTPETIKEKLSDLPKVEQEYIRNTSVSPEHTEFLRTQALERMEGEKALASQGFLGAAGIMLGVGLADLPAYLAGGVAGRSIALARNAGRLARIGKTAAVFAAADAPLEAAKYTLDHHYDGADVTRGVATAALFGGGLGALGYGGAALAQKFRTFAEEASTKVGNFEAASAKYAADAGAAVSPPPEPVIKPTRMDKVAAKAARALDFSVGGRLYHSSNDLISELAPKLTTVATQDLTKGARDVEGAVDFVHRTVAGYNARLETSMRKWHDAWADEQGLGAWAKVKSQAEFYQKAADLHTNPNWQAVPDVDKNVAGFVQDMRKLFADHIEQAKASGLESAKNIEADDLYLPRYYNRINWRGKREQFGIDGLEDVVAQAIKAGDPQLAMRTGSRIVTRAAERDAQAATKNKMMDGKLQVNPERAAIKSNLEATATGDELSAKAAAEARIGDSAKDTSEALKGAKADINVDAQGKLENLREGRDLEAAKKDGTAPEDAGDPLASTIDMPIREVVQKGDGGQSPFVSADGKILGTGGDHLSVAAPQEMQGLGLVRFHYGDIKEGGRALSVSVQEGQTLTPGHAKTLTRLADAKGPEQLAPTKFFVGGWDSRDTELTRAEFGKWLEEHAAKNSEGTKAPDGNADITLGSLKASVEEEIAYWRDLEVQQRELADKMPKGEARTKARAEADEMREFHKSLAKKAEKAFAEAIERRGDPIDNYVKVEHGVRTKSAEKTAQMAHDAEAKAARAERDQRIKDIWSGAKADEAAAMEKVKLRHFNEAFGPHMAEWEDKMLRRMARKFVSTVDNSVEGIHPDVDAALSTRDTALLRDALMRNGIVVDHDMADALADMMAPRTQRGPSNMRKRTVLDEVGMYAPAGHTEDKAFSMRDLMESDYNKIVDRYSRTMSPNYIMAQHGFQSESALRKYIGDVTAQQIGIDGYKDINAFRDRKRANYLTDMIYGREPEALRNVDPKIKAISSIVSNYGYARLGGSFGMAQTFDSAELVLRHGFEGFRRAIPSFDEMVQVIKQGGHEADALVRDLQIYAGVGIKGMDAKIVPNFQGLDSQLADSLTGTFLTKAMRTTKALSNGVAHLSGLNVLTDVQHFAAARIFLQTVRDVSTGLRTLDERLAADFGLSKANVQKFGALLEHAKYDSNGVLKDLNSDLLRKIDSRTFDALMGLTRREAFRTIIEPHAGLMPMIAGNSLAGKFAFQLKSFTMVANSVHTLGNMRLGPAYVAKSLIGGAAWAAMLYTLWTHVRSIGREDRAAYLEKAFAPDKLAFNVWNRMGMSGLTSEAMGAGLATGQRFGLIPKDTENNYGQAARASGLMVGSIQSIPVIDMFGGLMDSLQTGIDVVKTQRGMTQYEAKRMISLFPAMNAIPILQAVNAAVSGMPLKKKDTE